MAYANCLLGMGAILPCAFCNARNIIRVLFEACGCLPDARIQLNVMNVRRRCNKGVVCFGVCHFTRLFWISPIIRSLRNNGWICPVFSCPVAGRLARMPDGPAVTCSPDVSPSCLLSSGQLGWQAFAAVACRPGSGLSVCFERRGVVEVDHACFGAEAGASWRV